MKNNPITKNQALNYETRSSWISQFIWWEWLQKIVAKYYVWKTLRKYKRYQKSLDYSAAKKEVEKLDNKMRVINKKANIGSQTFIKKNTGNITIK